MSAFSASNSTTAVLMDSIPQFGGTIVTNSASQITIVSGSLRQNYYGSFRYTDAGEVLGTLTSTEFTNAATGMSYSLTGFSMDANVASKYVLSGSAQLLALDVLSGADSITGSSFSDRLFGYNGNDTFAGGAGNDRIDGGLGRDTALYSSSRSQATITSANGVVTVAENRSAAATDTLVNVERVRFADGAVAFDINGNAGQAYRLYQAALNRTPDAGGVGFQMNALDVGFSIQQIAQDFINSLEFQVKYGSNLSDDNFVTQLYSNVLHRAPDSGGFAYQVNALKAGMSRAQLLVNFSESPENYNATLVGIQNGIEYIPSV